MSLGFVNKNGQLEERPSFVWYHYKYRPNELGDLSLFQFSSNYEVVNTTNVLNDQELLKPIEGHCNPGTRFQRLIIKKAIILYPKSKDYTNNYKMKKVLLRFFVPWREVEQFGDENQVNHIFQEQLQVNNDLKDFLEKEKYYKECWANAREIKLSNSHLIRDFNAVQQIEIPENTTEIPTPVAVTQIDSEDELDLLGNYILSDSEDDDISNGFDISTIADSQRDESDDESETIQNEIFNLCPYAQIPTGSQNLISTSQIAQAPILPTVQSKATEEDGTAAVLALKNILTNIYPSCTKINSRENLLLVEQPNFKNLLSANGIQFNSSIDDFLNSTPVTFDNLPIINVDYLIKSSNFNTNLTVSRRTNEDIFKICDNYSLNLEQRFAMGITCPGLLLENEIPQLIRLVGEAGTGKSQVLKGIRDIYGDNLTILAPTSKAAKLINGRTIHSVVGYRGSSKKNDDFLSTNLSESNKLLLKNSKIIFIDEAYMCAKNLLEALHKRLADIKQTSNLLFGGTKIIVAGDPLQLPPVNGEMINKSTIWKAFDTCIHLDQKMRQTNVAFQSFLEKLRMGCCDSTDFEIMTKKCTKYQNIILQAKSVEEFISKFTIIVGRRIHTTMINRYIQSIRCSTTGNFIVHYHDNTAVTTTDYLRDQIFSADVSLTNEMNGKDKFFACGDRIMITQNISTPAGIVNGTTGVIKGFLYKSMQDLIYSQIPLGVFVQMDDIKDKAILITPSGRSKQIPIMLSNAATVHKLQGSSISNVLIDQDSCFFEPRLMYVAWSRATNLDSLYTMPLRMDKNKFVKKSNLIAGISEDLKKELEYNKKLAEH